MRSVRVLRPGGPEVLTIEDGAVPEPYPGEALVRVDAAGVNLLDTDQRTGRSPHPLPLTVGVEGAGTVEAIGPEVSEVGLGDRVAWAGVFGSYATHMVAPVERLVAVPPGLDLESAAAAMLQGLVAHALADAVYPLKPGDTCLVHAAAGGVGQLLTQFARARGARVIGTVSTEAGLPIAQAAGADDVVLDRDGRFARRVRALTAGRGVDVVYDAVGRDTFAGSLDCLRPRGLLAMYGQASGRVPAIDPRLPMDRGSVFLTWVSVLHYAATTEEYRSRAQAILADLAAGRLRVRIDRRFRLEEAGEAHRVLEAGGTTGKLLLRPAA